MKDSREISTTTLIWCQARPQGWELREKETVLARVEKHELEEISRNAFHELNRSLTEFLLAQVRIFAGSIKDIEALEIMAVDYFMNRVPPSIRERWALALWVLEETKRRGINRIRVADPFVKKLLEAQAQQTRDTGIVITGTEHSMGGRALVAGRFLFRALLHGSIQVLLLMGGAAANLFVGRLPQEKTWGEVFVAVDEINTGTARLFAYLKSIPADRTVQWLDLSSGLRPAKAGVRLDRINLQKMKPVDFGSFLGAIKDWKREMAGALFLAQWWQVLSGGRGSMAMAGPISRNLVRGAVAGEWVRRARFPAEAVFLFSNLRLDAALIDRALRRSGYFTVHWLHGTVEHSYKFRGFSNSCVALNVHDAKIQEKNGAYGNVGILPGPSSGGKPKELKLDRVLLLTNLLHPAQQQAKEFRKESLLRLFRLVSVLPAGLISWRPHPREKDDPDYMEILSVAEGLGIRLDPALSLAEAVASATAVVCTFSGAVGDTVKLGHVPLVWSEIRYENCGIWATIPGEIQFNDSIGLQAVLGNLQKENENQRLFDLCWEAWNCGAPALPAPGYFLNLKKENYG